MADERNRSEALNRPIDDWLHRIASGQLRLPSFQRGVAWDRGRAASMLTTIIHDLPLGITLILDVGDDERFHSRPLESAPDTDAKVTEHLLDGQQRLTALWRALKDNSDVTYFVHIPELDEDPHNDDSERRVRSEYRWTDKNGRRRPLWAENPEECRKRGLVPVRLLDPAHDAIDKWVDAAFPSRTFDPDAAPEAQVKALLEEQSVGRRRAELKDGAIVPLRERVRHYNLPYLRLPASTHKEVALRVFINMNTNAKPLRAYDIVVAELENATDVRLQERVDALRNAQPALVRYFGDVGDAVLQVTALMQGKQPSQRGYFELDYPRFVADWETMASGLQRLSELLIGDGIFTSAQVPSAPPLAVAAALLASAPAMGDERAHVDRLVRQYLWSAFFTTRYSGAAATRAAADYVALSACLNGTSGIENVPVFDREQYPLPSQRDLLTASWPKKADRLGRAILAASSYFGARDFADDTRLSAGNIRTREYHHLFPDALLRAAGIDSFLALNCVLITWKTNRTIGRLDPIRYLEDRSDKAPDPQSVAERLRTHLVPYGALAAAGPYAVDADGEELAVKLRPDFDTFLLERATLIGALAAELTSGKQPSLFDIVVDVEAHA